MKLERTGKDVKISGAQSGPQSFSIQNSAIAFTILSSKLYQDKILACIRELSCNAWDAHVVAGKTDVPFEIHLPTSFEPWFSVKDFGIGLNPKWPVVFERVPSEEVRKMDEPVECGFCHKAYDLVKVKVTRHVASNVSTWKTPCCGKPANDQGEDFYPIDRTERGEVRVGPVDQVGQPKDGQYVKILDQLVDLYCTYFASNKAHSNQVIGAMGLGSKSPFCYTEGFTVTSRYDGVTRIATSFINKQGTPAVSIQSTEETPDAPNGLEVMFPVKQEDIWEFSNKAKIALEFFEPRPVLNIELVIDKQEYSVKTETWGNRQNARTHHTSSIRAIQGNVQYSVGNIDISRMTPAQQQIAQMPLDLFFPIGSLAVAASRETLSNDEVTISNVLKMLDGIYDGMLDEVRKQLGNCKHAWEARLMVHAMRLSPGMGKIVNDAWNKGQLFGKYGNFKLDDKKLVINELDYDHTMMYRFSRNWRASRWATKSHVFKNAAGRDVMLACISSKSHAKHDYDMEIEVEKDDSVAFVINDLKFGGEKYIHYFLQEAADNQKNDDETKGRKTVVYLFSRFDKERTTAQVIAEAGKILTKLGNPPYEMLSALKERYKEIDGRDKVPSGPKEVRNILEFNPDGEYEKIGSSGYPRKGWTGAWKKAEPFNSDTKFYVAVESLKAIESGFDCAEDLWNLFKNARASGALSIPKDAKLYGLKVADKLRANPEWVDVVPYILSQVKSVMTPAKELEMSLLFKPFRSDLDDVLAKIATNKPLTKTSPMQVFAVMLREAQKSSGAANVALKHVLEVAENRKKYTPKGNITDFSGMFVDVLKGYPMLQYVTSSYHYNSTNVTMYKTLVEYVKAMDIARPVQAAAAAAAVAGDGSN